MAGKVSNLRPSLLARNPETTNLEALNPETLNSPESTSLQEREHPLWARRDWQETAGLGLI